MATMKNFIVIRCPSCAILNFRAAGVWPRFARRAPCAVRKNLTNAQPATGCLAPPPLLRPASVKPTQLMFGASKEPLAARHRGVRQRCVHYSTESRRRFTAGLDIPDAKGAESRLSCSSTNAIAFCGRTTFAGLGQLAGVRCRVPWPNAAVCLLLDRPDLEQPRKPWLHLRDMRISTYLAPASKLPSWALCHIQKTVTPKLSAASSRSPARLSTLYSRPRRY